MFFLDKKNYLHGICASNIQLFEEEPKIILLSKERKGLDLSSNSKEISFLIGFLRYNENYFIFVVLALEEIKNFRYFLLNILKEIKFFLIFHKVKFLLIENNEAFSSLFRKISKRIDYYFTSLQNKEQKYSIPIDFFMKSLKLCLPNHLPFYQLPELLTQELKRIFGLIFEPITSDLKLFSSSKNSLLPLGSCLFYKGLLLLNSLENELAYYLNSFSELNCKLI